ncbi:glycoside hydrolase family 76 protein [Rothia nasisuis]|uniref:glycoside hydrolase family 76 protein n=1 Tax=Rothia nasisuis TaxID=2109647 RepID=UPI001F375486|nr:glycoside hydrolase family 76 protein [Rothia nasisuis]
MSTQPQIRTEADPQRPRHAATSAEALEALATEHRATLGQRADTAAYSVMRLFGTRAAHIPGTLIGRAQYPDTRPRRSRTTEWHYWWQAHLLDALVDSGLRHQADGNQDAAAHFLKQGRAVLRGIQVRNYGTYPNYYYDDMAWLTLACERLNRLALAVEGSGDGVAQDAAARLYRQLADACTPEAGGGAFWSKDHNFKNTPATAPIALAFARASRYEEAASLLNWLHENLFDAETGLYLDGVKLTGQGPDAKVTSVERGLFTYNQGPVLGAYLVLLNAGHTEPLATDPVAHISEVLQGIDREFGQDFEVSAAESLRLVRTQGNGDGGLFTGVLVRYLAEIALHPALPAPVREQASNLVLATAEILWDGRREYDPELPMNEAGIDPSEIRGQAVALFSPDVSRHISEVVKPGQPIDLSTQVQAWMVLEAAARVF